MKPNETIVSMNSDLDIRPKSQGLQPAITPIDTKIPTNMRKISQNNGATIMDDK